MIAQLQSLHNCYCTLSGFEARYAIHERAYAEFIAAGFTEDDLRCVILFLKRENKSGNRTYSLRLNKLLDFEFRHFDSLLGEARARDRNRIKPPTNAQRVVEQFRHTKTVTGEAPMKSIGQILRELP
jgi:hypothetical protein